MLWRQQKIYTTKNVSTNKAHIPKLKNNRHAALKPLKIDSWDYTKC